MNGNLKHFLLWTIGGLAAVLLAQWALKALMLTVFN